MRCAKLQSRPALLKADITHGLAQARLKELAKGQQHGLDSMPGCCPVSLHGLSPTEPQGLCVVGTEEEKQEDDRWHKVKHGYLPACYV